jgi:tetratricopeptide (TPR) repeat protein
MNRRERRLAASKSKKASQGSSAATPAALCSAALAHLQAGRLFDAQLSCQKVLAIDPAYADSLYLMGRIALEAGQNDHAVEWLTRAMAAASSADVASSLGAALQRMGRFEEALQAFDKAIQLKPDDPQGWKNFANLLFDLQLANEAMHAYSQVLELDPRDWDAACRIGYLHYTLGQLEDALSYFGRCDALRPNDAPTLYMRSVFLLGLRRFEEAIAEGMRAHALDPTDAETCNTVGAALNELARHDEALPWFDRALGLHPGFDVALHNKAVALGKLQRLDEALAIHDRLKAGLGADSAVTNLNLANLLLNLGRREDALAALNLSLEKQPDDAAALQLRAVCLRGLRQLERSLADSRRAHALDPENAGICNNIGAVLHELGRHEEALPWLEMAIGAQGDYVEALNNMALAQHQLHRFDAAAETYHRVKAIAPLNAEAALGMAHLDLLRGNFAAGWAGREARWRVPGLPIVYPNFSQPMWLGQSDISSKTILIYADEGMGDAIQLARYVPMVAALGARVVLAVHAALVPLLSRVEGVSQCVTNNLTDAIPAFDTYCPMLSLPLAFETQLGTIPGKIPYLPRPAEDRVRAWHDRLPPHGRLRVGLAWAGNPNHSNDVNRSIPLRALARILDADATFVSLQKDLRPDDKSILEQSNLVDPTAGLTDFAETAALLCCLDLVISADTSVAHLAGALGRPTWLLLPHTPDYRWLLDRDDSPWYPTLRLYRQTEKRDWSEVLARVRNELVLLASSFGHRVRQD